MAMLHQQIMKLKMSYFGHVISGEGLKSDVMLGMGEGKRKARRPRRRWIDELREQAGMTLLQMKETARSRIGWRKVGRTSPKVDPPT